jgi:hypothetical protein
MCCFYAAFRKKSKDWLAQNKENMFGWSNMSTRNPTKCVGLVQADIIIISLNVTWSRYAIIGIWAYGVKQQPLTRFNNFVFLIVDVD